MSTASEMVELYMTAEKGVLEGKQVRMFGRDVTMEDLAEIRAGRQEWEARLEAESTSSKRKPFQILVG